jgi:hypothetical protein
VAPRRATSGAGPERLHPGTCEAGCQLVAKLKDSETVTVFEQHFGEIERDKP